MPARIEFHDSTLSGRLLFTSEAEPLMWNDAMTGLESRSLGAAEYRRLLSSVGLSVVSEYEDEGENYYFDAVKKGTVAVSHRSRLFFLLLVVAQVAHSVEEYATRLYEVFAPARLVSELFSDDVAVGFVIANAIIITVGIWCYVGPVRSGRGAARLVAWLWTVIELANGIGHIILAVLARGYFPGAMTAVVLVYAAASLASSLRADWHRTHRLTRYCEAPWF